MKELANNKYRCKDGTIIYAPNYETALRRCNGV